MLYGQDTLIELPISIVKGLYADALQKDSCQAQYQLLDSVVAAQEKSLALHHELLRINQAKYNNCEVGRAAAIAARDSVFTENTELKLRVQNRNKWVARLGVASGIEALLLVLILL